MKTFQFYTKKSWFEEADKDAFYFLTRLVSGNAASGIVLTLYTKRKLELHCSIKDSINAMPSLYLEISELEIQNLLSNELKHLFITLFFEGINKCL